VAKEPGDTHNGIGDLIANLVWVTLTDRLGGEQEVAGGKWWASGGVTVGGHFGGCGMQDEGGIGAEVTPGLRLFESRDSGTVLGRLT